MPFKQKIQKLEAVSTGRYIDVYLAGNWIKEMTEGEATTLTIELEKAIKAVREYKERIDGPVVNS